MNLRNIANARIQIVNPDQQIVWRKSTGYTKDEYYRQVPTYEESTIKGNVQALSTADLQLMNGMNVGGTMRKVYASVNIQNVSRPDGVGGDLLVFPQVVGGEAQTWLVTQVTEPWNGRWCCVIVRLQND